MNRTAILAIFCAAITTTALVPAGTASHDDPTHGVLPHSVADDPTAIDPVNVSTPHPYDVGETYTWTVEADGADSISLHFERYYVDGDYNPWLGGCSGSTVTITDAVTGAELETLCGSWDDRPHDFWTDHYDTNAVEIELDTTGAYASERGFDIYEVATNGAEPIASIPYTAQPSSDTKTEHQADADPVNPTETDVHLVTDHTTTYGEHVADHEGSVDVGTFVKCGGGFTNPCTDYEGVWVTQDYALETAADTQATASLELLVVEDGESDTGYTVQEAHVTCDVNGEASCPAPGN